MKKSQFVKLLAGAVGGLLFSLGMCMCLLPEWNALAEGKTAAAAGLVILLALGAAGLIKKLRGGLSINWKNVGKTVYGVISALVLGAGMCMVMVWQMMLYGIIVGIVGIVMLLCLIPMCIGFRK